MRFLECKSVLRIVEPLTSFMSKSNKCRGEVPLRIIADSFNSTMQRAHKLKHATIIANLQWEVLENSTTTHSTCGQ